MDFGPSFESMCECKDMRFGTMRDASLRDARVSRGAHGEIYF